ncbi:MAG: T9SS type A sorting domain-containing protein [Flammeovirgaceae bacterium]
MLLLVFFLHLISYQLIRGTSQKTPFSAVAFPNPSNGQELNLRFINPTANEAIKIQIMTLDGKVVHTEMLDPQHDLKASTSSLHLKEPLKAGLYFVIINQGTQAEKVKVLIH